MSKIWFTFLLTLGFTVDSATLNAQKRYSWSIDAGTPGMWLIPVKSHNNRYEYLQNSGIKVNTNLNYRLNKSFYLKSGICATSIVLKEISFVDSYPYDRTTNYNIFLGIPFGIAYNFKLTSQQALQISACGSLLNFEINNPIDVHFRDADSTSRGRNDYPILYTLEMDLKYTAPVGSKYLWGIGVSLLRIKEDIWSKNKPNYRPWASDYYKTYFQYTIDHYFIGVKASLMLNK